MDTLGELRYIMATTTDKSASMLPPTKQNTSKILNTDLVK